MVTYNQNTEKGDQNSSTSNNITAQPTMLNEDEDLKDNNFGSNILRVTTSTTGDIIYLGNQAFHKSDLLNAFGGELNPGIHPPPSRPMGNPVPVGLVGFAICTFTVGMVFVEARGLTIPNMLAAPALFLGGIITAIAGFWSLLVENAFAAACLCGFGGFYMSYAGILLDSFGIAAAYADAPDQFNNIMGFFLMAWTIFAFSMWLCTFKATWSFFLIIGFVVIYLFLLMVSYFADSLGVRKGAGVCAILAALSAFYAIYEGIANGQNSYIVPPQFPMPGAPRV